MKTFSEEFKARVSRMVNEPFRDALICIGRWIEENPEATYLNPRILAIPQNGLFGTA